VGKYGLEVRPCLFFSKTQDYLHLLRKIDQAIARNLDLQATLEFVLNQITMLMGIDAVALFLWDPRTNSLNFKMGKGFHFPQDI